MIDDIMRAANAFRDLPPRPKSVRLHPDDIELLKRQVAAKVAVPPEWSLATITGIPIIPDETIARGEPKWEYA